MVVAILLVGSTAGCMNLATKSSEITGSYTSDLKYQNYSCDQLGIEVNSLARREDQLVTAQEQRRKSSKVQAFWIGYGNGDGIEASELANVRGEKEAVRRAMDRRSCDAPRAVRPETTATTAEVESAAPAAGNNGSWRSWGKPMEAGQQSKTLYRCAGNDGAEVITETPAPGCIVVR